MANTAALAAGQPRHSWREAMGLALIICGQPIGWSIRGQLLPGSENPIFPAGVILLGLALMANPAWIVRRDLQCSPAMLAIPMFGLFVPYAALAALAPAPIVLTTMAYAIVLVVLTLVVAMTPSERLAALPAAVLLVGTISSVLPLIELAAGGPAKGFFRLTVSGNENPLIIGNIGGITVLAGMVVGLGPAGGSAKVGLAAGLGTAIGLLAMLLSNTRSAALMIVVCALVFLTLVRPRLARPAARARSPRTLAYVAVLAASVAAAPTIAIALLGPELFWDLAKVGLLRFAGALALVAPDAGSVDLSTSIRTQLLREVWDNMTIGGEGYMAQALRSGDPALYPHLSYIQAFYDLGLVGGLSFLLIILVLPAALAVAALWHGRLSPTNAFVLLLLLFSQGDHLSHGTPYSWTSSIPALLMYTLVARGVPRRDGLRLLTRAA